MTDWDDRRGELSRWVEATGEELPGMVRIVASTTRALDGLDRGRLRPLRPARWPGR